MKLLPTLRYKRIFDIPYEIFNELNVSLVLLDMDNTTAPWHSDEVCPKTSLWVKNAKSTGVTVALLTNADDVKYQYNKLDLLGLRDCFDRIIISGEYAKLVCGDEKNREYEKPDTRIFKYAAAQLNADPSELYYVGDNAINDIMGACNSGFVPIWVRSRSPWVIDNKYMPKICVDHVLDILKTDGIF